VKIGQYGVPLEKNVGLSILKDNFPPDQIDQLVFNEKPLSTFEPYVFLTNKDTNNVGCIKQFDIEFEKFMNTRELKTIMDSCDQ